MDFAVAAYWNRRTLGALVKYKGVGSWLWLSFTAQRVGSRARLGTEYPLYLGGWHVRCLYRHTMVTGTRFLGSLPHSCAEKWCHRADRSTAWHRCNLWKSYSVLGAVLGPFCKLFPLDSRHMLWCLLCHIFCMKISLLNLVNERLVLWVLCSFIWSNLCQILPGDDTLTEIWSKCGIWCKRIVDLGFLQTAQNSLNFLAIGVHGVWVSFPYFLYRSPCLVGIPSHFTVGCKSVNYRPRSEGDNVLGSVRPSVRRSPLSRLNRLTY